MQIQLLSGTPTPGLREYKAGSEMNDQISELQQERLGVLIGLKIDWKNTGEKLRWGYLNTASLKNRGLSDRQIADLKSKLVQAEGVYSKLGGDRKDFARAIVEGHGNRDQIVKPDKASLGEISVREEERILLTSPAQLLLDLKSASGLGSLDSNQNADAFARAGTTLSKISQIASGVSTITGTLSTITQKEETANANIDQAPGVQQAGLDVTTLGSWIGEHRRAMMAGGALLLAGLFITQMKHSEEDPGRRPKAGRKLNSKLNRTRKQPTRNKRGNKRKSKSSALGIIELS
ncbi:hypothetical protein [Catalinimonas niigatensis]|uniref:hypothetical protein n=1 Tax=Catalinimonas niigatensis TaxID=1397264 RepID=UPI00266654B4|nr:hypothetical protein [Catalinimonas niigatensis]WPP48958.1 hypothetical protein PZB72_20025 [Catalinimonas niigatensis]